MTTLFLYTFFVGFTLTLISAVLGFLHLGGDMHAHGDAGHIHGGHVDAGHAHTGHVHAGHGAGDANSVSPINFQTLMAFLMGFGGVGYLVTLVGLPGVIVAVPLAAGGGVGTSWLIYKWLRFLVRGERPLGPTAYVGLVGRLTVSIREGGTGELVYTDHGTRSVLAARSADGAAIPKGAEVVILRYEKGIAYVQPLHDHIDEGGSGA